MLPLLLMLALILSKDRGMVMKYYKALVLIGLLLITACARLQNPVNNDRLAAIESTYGIALSGAVAYRNLRMCKKGEIATLTNICSYRDVIIKMQIADVKAQDAIANAKRYIAEHPFLDAFDILSLAQKAVSEFQGIQTAYGIGKPNG